MDIFFPSYEWAVINIKKDVSIMRPSSYRGPAAKTV